MVSQFRPKAADYVTETKSKGVLMGDKAIYTQKVINGWRWYEEALVRGLQPTPWFFEALHYTDKARKLQTASLAGKPVPKVGDPLMEAIPIYNTVQRRYAGFSNVPEFLWYGRNAPKYDRSPIQYRGPRVAWSKRKGLEQWLYVTLVHRITGSGASFEHDHGWRNNRVVEMSEKGSVAAMAGFISSYDGPIFTSLGNQIPPFPPIGGREYLRQIAPDLVMMVTAALMTWKAQRLDPMPIKQCVDMVLKFHKVLGCKQFKFVLTAWVMDMAEYMPQLVDPTSDVYHGKNAVEAIELCFDYVKPSIHGPSWSRQLWYDMCTRLFADYSGTNPMDVEDASPGCDLIRWVENCVPKKGFDHVIEKSIYNGSSLAWRKGRQPPPF